MTTVVLGEGGGMTAYFLKLVLKHIIESMYILSYFMVAKLLCTVDKGQPGYTHFEF